MKCLLRLLILLLVVSWSLPPLTAQPKAGKKQEDKTWAFYRKAFREP